MTVELKPKCFEDQQMAVTNRGHLIPCCYCDTQHTMNDLEFQKLLKVSKISDYNSIEEILNTNEWKEFYKNLQQNIGPRACQTVCAKNKKDPLNIKEIEDGRTGKIIHTRIA